VVMRLTTCVDRKTKRWRTKSSRSYTTTLIKAWIHASIASSTSQLHVGHTLTLSTYCSSSL
jgi:hypothetical protein